MNTKKEAAVVKKIIKRHGAVINLDTNPEIMVEIIRDFGDALYHGRVEPGEPEPPTQPKIATGVSTAQLMKAVLKLSREINALKSAVLGKQRTK